MSLLSQLYDKVVTLTGRLNQIEENAKTNDEFPTQSELVLSSKIRVSNGGVTEVISVEDIILKAVATSQPYLNRFIETTGISSTGLGININPNWIWMINGIRYTNIVENSFVNYYSATGFERIDIIVATESQDFLLIHGEEAEVGVESPVAPVLPINALLVTTILVGDDSMDSPTIPESGYDFLISTDSDNAIVIGSDGKLWSGGGSGGSVPDATESVKGKAQLATVAETLAGANDTKIVTPLKLLAVSDALAAEIVLKEDSANKVTSITGNETSTTLYASVKAMVDWIASRGFITSVVTDLGYTPENSANKGAANGYVPLNSSVKIDTTYLPDSILGQLLYGGVFDASTAIATLTNNAKSKLGTGSSTITLTNNTTAITGYAANEGVYYIATVAGTFASISFEVGDWLVSIGSAWKKIDNTDAITSFNSRTGAITLISSDVTSALGYTPLNKSGDTILGDIGNTSTGFFRVASGTTAQRPVTPLDGMIRYNTTTQRTEFYSNGSWRNHARLEGDTFTGPIAATNLSGNNTGDQDLSALESKTVQTTGSIISFSTRQRYNSIASPTSGNITDNLTGARTGVVQKIFSNRSTTPTFPSGWVKRGSGNYIPSTLNIIYAEWEEGTTVSYWITQ